MAYCAPKKRTAERGICQWEKKKKDYYYMYPEKMSKTTEISLTRLISVPSCISEKQNYMYGEDKKRAGARR